MDSPYVLLGDGSQFGQKAQLFIKDEALQEAAALRPGQKTTMLCDGAEGGIGTAIAKDCVFYIDYMSRAASDAVVSVRRWLTDGTPSPYVTTPARKVLFITHSLMVHAGYTCNPATTRDSCGSRITALFSKANVEHYRPVITPEYEANQSKLGLLELHSAKKKSDASIGPVSP
jgi:hypothetical protein